MTTTQYNGEEKIYVCQRIEKKNDNKKKSLNKLRPV